MAITVNTTPSKVNLSGNRIKYELETDITGANIENLYIHIEIMVFDGVDYVKDAEASKEAVNNLASFNLSTYLDRKHQPVFTYPSPSLYPYIPSDYLKKFRIAYYESYLDTSTSTVVITTKTEESVFYYVLQGGISKKLELTLLETSYTIWGHIKKNELFLNNLPADLPVARNMDIPLTWIIPPPGEVTNGHDGTIRMNLQYTKTDLSVTSSYSGLPAINDYDVFRTNLRFSEHLSEAEFADTIEIKAWLSNMAADVIYSEYLTFKPNSKYFERNFFFYFQNSLGAFDPAWARGYNARNAKLTRQSYAKELQEDSDLETPELYNTRATRQEANVADFGYLNEGEHNYLLDFYQSEQVFLLENEQAFPVRIKTSQLPISNDQKDILSKPFTFEPAYRDKYYSKNY